MFKVPVLLIAFNRPDTTVQVLKAIQNYFPDILYFAVDGPRKEKPAELGKVQTVQNLPRAGIHAQRVVPLYQDDNLGCRRAVPEAIHWFFQHEESGIILEDDCVPSDDFWSFIPYCLEKFREETRIGHVSGNNLLCDFNSRHSYYFSNLNHVWGWGTWRRAWEKYSVVIEDSLTEVQSVVASIFPRQTFVQKWWVDHIWRASHGEIDTWDYQWTYALWKYGMLSITPAANLVINIGFDQDATHTKSSNFPGADLRHEPLPQPYKDPLTIRLNKGIDGKVLKSHYRLQRNRLKEMLHSIRSFFSPLKQALTKTFHA